MNKEKTGKFLIVLALVIKAASSVGQTKAIKTTLWDGIIIGGYVDRGGFLNLLGPSVSISARNTKFSIGMLPSLRFKTDNKIPRNTFVTTGLGLGVTYNYKHWAIQLPVFYNPKTAIDNGKWKIGLGMGLRLNGIKKKGELK